MSSQPGRNKSNKREVEASFNEAYMSDEQQEQDDVREDESSPQSPLSVKHIATTVRITDLDISTEQNDGTHQAAARDTDSSQPQAGKIPSREAVFVDSSDDAASRSFRTTNGDSGKQQVNMGTSR